jgi:hypothetical protein
VSHPKPNAREPRSRAFFWSAGLAALLLAGSVGEAGATHDQQRPIWDFKYRPCRNDQVAGLVGRRVDDALAKVRDMRLLAVRVLDRWTWVNYEVVPERLTMVVHDNGVVVRAFCR